jgi:two-component system sensor histidine kinase PilS (NtrC family)
VAGPGGAYPESFWRSLKHLNDFRLFLSAFFFILALFTERLHLISTNQIRWFLVISLLYGLVCLAFVHLRRRRRFAFERQLSLQLLTDITVITLLMHLGGGIETGLGLVLIVPMAAAGMYSESRNMLTATAVAAIAVLLEQTVQDWGQSGLLQGYARAALLSAGFFTVAGLSHFLAKGTLAATRLAGERAEEVASLERINARVIQDLPYGVVVVDGVGRLLQANQQAEKVLGCRMPERGELKTCLPEVDALWQAWRQGGSETLGFIESAGDGRRLRVRLSELDPERLTGAVIVLEDMTELEQQAVNIKLAALGRLTANLAHEIRNPLSAINHAGQLLQEELAKDPYTGKLTRIIEDNVKRLNWLVEDVLTLNRRDRVSREAVALQTFLPEFLQHFQQSEQVAEGVIQAEEGEWPSICFDRMHLHQILWNLCRNASRYCSGQAGSVRINAQGEGDRVHVDIYNDGPAVSPEIQMRLFEPFYTTEASGTGLGLFIARELAEANDGQLRSLPQATGALFRLVCQQAPCKEV